MQVEARDLTIKRAPFGEIELTVLQGTEVKSYRGVQVKLPFPLSSDEGVVSFWESDGDEIAVLQDMIDLDPSSAEALRQALEVNYFVPRITKVVAIKEEFGVCRWSVMTDRGPRQFDVQSRQDIRPVGKNRWLIRDIDGNRFEICNVESLDTSSRALLDIEL